MALASPFSIRLSISVNKGRPGHLGSPALLKDIHDFEVIGLLDGAARQQFGLPGSGIVFVNFRRCCGGRRESTSSRSC